MGLGATPALSPCPAVDPRAALEPRVLPETQFCFFQSVTAQVLFCVLQTYFGNWHPHSLLTLYLTEV